MRRRQALGREVLADGVEAEEVEGKVGRGLLIKALWTMSPTERTTGGAVLLTLG